MPNTEIVNDVDLVSYGLTEGTTSLESNAVDTRDYLGIMFVATMNLVGVTLEILVEHGDTDQTAEHVAAPTSDIIGFDTNPIVFDNSELGSAKLGYRGDRRYVSIDMSVSGGTATLSLIGLFSPGRYQPFVDFFDSGL